jgi:hypothetical protein
MITPRRYRALRWFDDHSRDQNSVLAQRVPTKKIRNLMIRDGQLEAVAIGSFGHLRFELTAAGRTLLASRRRRKTKTTTKESDHDDDTGIDAGHHHERSPQISPEAGAGE